MSFHVGDIFCNAEFFFFFSVVWNKETSLQCMNSVFFAIRFDIAFADADADDDDMTPILAVVAVVGGGGSQCWYYIVVVVFVRIECSCICIHRRNGARPERYEAMRFIS